jgi:hypothetical protein
VRPELTTNPVPLIPPWQELPYDLSWTSRPAYDFGPQIAIAARPSRWASSLSNLTADRSAQMRPECHAPRGTLFVDFFPTIERSEAPAHKNSHDCAL